MQITSIKQLNFEGHTFHSYYDASVGADVCWPWLGAIDKSGYGRCNAYCYETGRMVRVPAHRAMYLLMHGDVPDRYRVEHTCQGENCVNPAHLIATRFPSAAQPDREHSQAHRFITTMDVSLVDEADLSTMYEVSPDECWLWRGRINQSGYGVYCVEQTGQLVSAHRLMYMLACGDIPSNHFIDHLCYTKNCVNPEHLEPVLPVENVRRAILHYEG